MVTITKLASVQWPSEIPTKVIQCAGQEFVEWEARRQGITEEEMLVEETNGAAELLSEDQGPSINLLKVSLKKLERLTYYDCLGGLPLHATPEQVKKAYHKACLVYHPDKTGRGEEDEVFLKVKAAFDTLSDKAKRKAYDSQMPFDDSIPKGSESSTEFFETYAPVFERNLRFDDRLNPDRKQPTNGGGKKKNKRKSAPKGPPAFGDDETPLDHVHSFYDYWVHFESWRDFSLQAAKLTNNANFDADNVDSRYEKRFIQKEIDRKAKVLKREEMARINLLVERAMAADPRLRKEKQRLQEEKDSMEREKREKQERETREKKEKEERESKEKAEREAREKEEKSKSKADKEKQKKILRKAKSSLRKLCIAAQATGKTYWTSMETMYDDVEYLCECLGAMELNALTDALGGPDASESPKLEGVDVVQEKVMTLKEGKTKEQAEAAVKAEQDKRAATNGTKEPTTNGTSVGSWTVEEDRALQEALAKFPASMDKNERWGSISKECGKSKKECVERFKAIREALKKKK